MKVYHGSLINIKGKYLKPNKAFNNNLYKPCVYFSTSYINALLYSVNPIRSYLKNCNDSCNARAFSAHIDFTKTPPIIHELYNGMFEELFNTSCFIYISDIDEVETQEANKEIVFEGKAIINEKIKIANFYQELLKEEKNKNIGLKRFKDWNDGEYSNFIYDKISTKASQSETCGEIKFYRNKFANNMEIQKSVNEALEKMKL